MPFTTEQQTALLAEKGIGKTVLQRLTQMGLDDVEALANADIEEVLTLGAMLTGSSCWKNSPQAVAFFQTASQRKILNTRNVGNTPCYKSALTVRKYR